MKNIKIPNEYIFKEDYVILIITSPTHGIFNIKIDLDDYNFVKNKQWCINKYCSNKDNQIHIKYYASCKGELLHRLLMNCPKELVVDHVDGDYYNYRRNNLRICTNAENVRNGKKNFNNKSGHRGVYWAKEIPTPKWVAYITKNWKRFHLGYFDNLEDAIEARLKAEKEYYGEFNGRNLKEND